MVGKNYIVKNSENFSEHNAKISPENSLPLPKVVKNEKIYSVMTSMTKFTQS